MNKLSTNPETVRKRNSKKREMEENRQDRLKRDRERKRIRKERENEEEHSERLLRQQVNRLQRKAKETAKDRIKRLEYERKKKRNLRQHTTQRRQETAGERQETVEGSRVRPKSQTINEEEHKTLKKFRKKIDKRSEERRVGK